MSNIPACLLGSAQTQQDIVISDIMANEYRIVYATPEFCAGDYGLKFLKQINEILNVDLLAIDEAHCVSQWGHDFRLKYRELHKLRPIFRNVPILAVTATATSDVKSDIIKSLKLKNPNTFCSGFDRPNLYFEVVVRNDSNPMESIRPYMVKENGKWTFAGSTIIYCLTIKLTEKIATVLTENNIVCTLYHASLPMKQRKRAHELFAKDQIKVVVATIAFGMGIDKPDVRMVIHYGASKDIESYYQEVGRAGRDGLPSKCVLLHSSSDYKTHEYFREHTICKTDRKTLAQKEYKDRMSQYIQKYIDTLECRRKFILTYFQENTSQMKNPKRNCCDNCTMRLAAGNATFDNFTGLNTKGKYNLAEDTRVFLECVNSVKVETGIATYVAILRGGKSAKMKHFTGNPKYGKGLHKSDGWWRTVGKIVKKIVKANRIHFFLYCRKFVGS